MVFVSLGLFALALMLMRLAYASVDQDFGIWLMGACVFLMIAAIVVFAIYFKEK